MSSRTLDLRKVWGTIITYNYINEALVAPEKPFTSVTEFFPGAESPVHLHPEQEEIFEVQEGEVQIFLDGKWKTIGAGEKIIIPKASPHAVRNTAENIAIATNIHSPGLRMGEMLETIQQYISDKKISGPKGFKNMAYMASIILNYPEEMVMVKPTLAQTRMVAKAGRMFGYK